MSLFRSAATLAVLWLLAEAFVYPAQAHAYLDPGTGSIILQAILGSVVVAGMYLRTVRDRVLRFFRGNRPAAGAVEVKRDETVD